MVNYKIELKRPDDKLGNARVMGVSLGKKVLPFGSV